VDNSLDLDGPTRLLKRSTYLNVKMQTLAHPAGQNKLKQKFKRRRDSGQSCVCRYSYE